MSRKQLSRKQKEVLLQYHGYQCANTRGYVMGWICPLQGKSLTLQSAQFDHIKELSDGGSNELSNFQVLCACCHDQKSRANQNLRSKGKMEIDCNIQSKRCSKVWTTHWQLFRKSQVWMPNMSVKEEYVEFARWCESHKIIVPTSGTFKLHYNRYVEHMNKHSEPMDVDIIW